MILVTGAAGKTGRAVISALVKKGAAVRALVRRPEQENQVLHQGASQVIVGDLADRATIARAVDGVSALYHICPNVDPLEQEYAEILIQEAIKAQVGHLGYHSVLHPQTELMVHHWRKLRVEEALFECGLPYTILQPCAYMQNLASFLGSIRAARVIRVPYSLQAKLSLVDLLDVAAAVATVLCEPDHLWATYELAGPVAMDHIQIAATFQAILGIPVRAEQLGLDTWTDNAIKSGLGDEQVSALRAMFAYYDKFGLRGNPTVLAHLLGRQPYTLEDVIRREMTDR